jgi:hypothetical protein
MNNLNTARAPNIKDNSPEVEDVVNFADRFWYALELKVKKLRTIMQKSDNHYNADMTIIRIQALEWMQGRVQDLILNNVTRDWPHIRRRIGQLTVIICLLYFSFYTS